MTQLAPLASTQARPKPTSIRATVLDNRPYADRYWYLRLSAPGIADRARPGQFVMITAARRHEPGPVLPRPMAIYTRSHGTGVLDIVYGVVGDGTRALSTFAPGESLTVTGPLGQGFVIAPQTQRILLIGRGIGTCSLTTMAQDLATDRMDVHAVLSGRGPASVIGADVFRQYGAREIWTVNDAEGTSDAAHLRRRLRHAYRERPPQQILACGSERLAQLSAELAADWGSSVQVSVEAHMACGIGYCHGCAAGPANSTDAVEPWLACRDGPVFALDLTTPEDKPSKIRC